MSELGVIGVNATMKSGESDDDYHASRGISASGFKLFAECQAKYWAKYICPDPEEAEAEDKAHFAVGKAVHCWVLEPERFNDSFIAMPGGIDKRTKVGKDFWQTFQEKHKGKKILSESEMRVAMECGNAILRHPHAKFIRESRGIAECSIRWTDTFIDENGNAVSIERKCRPDFFVPPCSQLPNGVIFDLKAVEDASISGFTRSSYNFGYHIQAPWYQDGLQQFYGTAGRAPFVFMVVEKKYPWLVKAYDSTPSFLTYGKRIIDQKLPQFAKAIQTGVWAGYGDNIEALDLPSWVQKKEKYQNEW